MTYTANSFVKNVNYAYNNVGGLSGIGTNIRAGGAANDTTNVMSGFLYRGFGAVKQVNYGNGKQMTANYDAKRLQMTYMSVHAASNVNDKIVSLDYNYYTPSGSNNGRIQKITDYLDAAYTTTYGYDDQNRLSSASATAVTRSYTYDPWANLLTTSGTGPNEWGYTPTTNYSYTLNYATNASGAPATNRLSNQFQYYDNAGNMTVDLNGHVYTYDAANRIKNVGNNKFMEYDGDGHRVLSDESAIGNTKFWYLWSSVLNQPVVELGSAGGVFRAYVYSPGGGLVAQQSYDEAFHWVHQDHLGSGHKMTDSTGAVVYTERFDPHGQSVLRISNSGPYYQSHKFTGYERDYGTNTDNAKARQYHHNNGRFMQPDPLSLGASDLSNPQSLNLYSYVQNDPVNNIDPSGMLLAEVCGWVYQEGVGNNDQGGQVLQCVVVSFGGIGGSTGSSGGGDSSGGDTEEPPVLKISTTCPKPAGSSYFAEITQSGFVGLGAGAVATASTGVFRGTASTLAGGVKATSGEYTSAGASYTMRKDPVTGDRDRETFAIGTSVTLVGVNIGKAAYGTADSYAGKARTLTFSFPLAGLAGGSVNFGFAANSSYPNSISGGVGLGFGFGVASTLTKATAKSFLPYDPKEYCPGA